MVIAGIIAEYNPFHNGHTYQIRRLKELTGADYCIAAMSGDFVQRGTPAVLDKYSRTRMALSCGLDMVVELPTIYATASAEWFARGGVALLAACGVTHLGFGAECTSLETLLALADLFLEEPPLFRETLLYYQKNGKSYPAARAAAAAHYLKSQASAGAALSVSADDAFHILEQPNNILAIEYLKAIRELAPRITPVLIPRIGADYHSNEISGSFSSATAIRQLLYTVSSGESALADHMAKLSSVMPAKAVSLLSSAASCRRFITPDALSGALGHLLNFPPQELPDDALGRRSYSQSSHFTGFSDYCQLLHTKDTTLAAVSRRLLHLLLSIPENCYRKTDKDAFSVQPPYIRILGFRKASSALLSRIAESSPVPVISRPQMGTYQLMQTASPRENVSCFETDLHAAAFYNSLVRMQGGQSVANDFSEPMVILRQDTDCSF